VVLCSWCDDPAAFFMVSDRSGAHVDRACDVHMIRWRSAYQRALKLPPDVRAGTPSPWVGLDLVLQREPALACAAPR
jgi:hypothetical protein